MEKIKRQMKDNGYGDNLNNDDNEPFDINNFK